MGAGWDGLWGACGLEVCGMGAGKISQIPESAGWEQTKNFNPRGTLVDTKMEQNLSGHKIAIYGCDGFDASGLPAPALISLLIDYVPH